MKKVLSIGMIAVMLLMLLAGCGSGKEAGTNQTSQQENAGESAAPNTESGEPVTLTFASWSITEEATKDALEQMVEMYKQIKPNVTIEFIGIPFGDIKQQTFVMASSNNTPDIIQTFSATFPTYATSDIIAPLDDLLGQEYIDDLMPSMVADYSYNGQLMGVPWAPSPYVLYYNKELFKQAGLEDRAPATYDQMIEMAKAISQLKTDSGEPIYGFGEATDKLPINGMISLRNIYSFGGSIFDENGQVNVNTPQVVETLQFYQDLVNNNISPQGAKLKDLRNLFSIGRLGMYMDGYYGKAVFRSLSGKGEEFDKEWGVALVPKNKTDQSVSIAEAHGLVVSADSKHKQEAADFIKFLTDQDAISLYHQKSDVLTSRISLSESPEFNASEFDKVLIEQLQTAKSLPANNPGLEQAYLDMSEAVQRVSVAKEDPAKVAADLDAKLKQILK